MPAPEVGRRFVFDPRKWSNRRVRIRAFHKGGGAADHYVDILSFTGEGEPDGETNLLIGECVDTSPPPFETPGLKFEMCVRAIEFDEVEYVGMEFYFWMDREALLIEVPDLVGGRSGSGSE